MPPPAAGTSARGGSWGSAASSGATRSPKGCRRRSPAFFSSPRSVCTPQMGFGPDANDNLAQLLRQSRPCQASTAHLCKPALVGRGFPRVPARTVSAVSIPPAGPFAGETVPPGPYPDPAHRTQTRRRLCSMGCQAAFTLKAKTGWCMVEFDEQETPAQPAFVRAGARNGADRQGPAVRPADAERHAMAEIAAESEIPF